MSDQIPVLVRQSRRVFGQKSSGVLTPLIALQSYKSIVSFDLSSHL